MGKERKDQSKATASEEDEQFAALKSELRTMAHYNRPGTSDVRNPATLTVAQSHFRKFKPTLTASSLPDLLNSFHQLNSKAEAFSILIRTSSRKVGKRRKLNELNGEILVAEKIREVDREGKKDWIDMHGQFMALQQPDSELTRGLILSRRRTME